jgi:hypothetical protein
MDRIREGQGLHGLFYAAGCVRKFNKPLVIDIKNSKYF